MPFSKRPSAKQMLGRILLITAVLIAASALAKSVLFMTALEPDDSGRQRIEATRDDARPNPSDSTVETDSATPE
ncbi:hypothetical protein [Marinobacter sp. V034]|uniref:hypothetical protein n=1 Tax=Marinobacter sp. V034 TaxID=3459610 RepID=UPI0040446845